MRQTVRKHASLFSGVFMVSLLVACGAQSDFDAKEESEVAISVENQTEEAALVAPACQVTWQRELLITDPKVTGNPAFVGAGKPWNFGTLLKRATPAGQNTATWVKNWFNTFGRVTTVNGEKLPARDPDSMSLFLSLFPKVAGGAFDVNKLPFKLVAIVYRPDLALPATNKAGELHFVYQMLIAGELNPFTVSLDYRLSGDRLAWARKFHTLKGIATTDARFPGALEGITRLATTAQPAKATLKGNLVQLLSSEVALGDPQEMRRFLVKPTGLIPATLPGTPNRALDNTPTLARAIKTLRGAVPTTFEGKPFAGGRSTVHDPFAPRDLGGPVELWRAPGVPAATMKAFSLKTCGGCHGTINGTPRFHIQVGERGKIDLSPYLLSSTGKTGAVISRANTLQKILCPTAR